MRVKSGMSSVRFSVDVCEPLVPVTTKFKVSVLTSAVMLLTVSVLLGALGVSAVGLKEHWVGALFEQLRLMAFVNPDWNAPERA